MDHTVLAQWRMTHEIDTLPFEVERSRDKRRWERIAAVAVHSSNQYSITDSEIFNRIIEGFSEYAPNYA
jgi:hypothetical protein